MSPKKCCNALCTKADAPAVLKTCSRCKKATYCSPECQAASWKAHQPSCQRPNYVIKVHLFPKYIKNPAVVRTISCPANSDFQRLHMVLQAAFGWATTHLFQFTVKDPSCIDPEGVTQFIFRKTRPRNSSGRVSRSRLLRLATNYQLHQLLEYYQGMEVIYTYDFGDGWDHYMTVVGRADPTSEFVCLDGSGHPVAEDVGGFPGWESLKANYRTANPTEEQEEARFWFENWSSNRDPVGLFGDRVNFWDRDMVNRDLEIISRSTLVDKYVPEELLLD